MTVSETADGILLFSAQDCDVGLRLDVAIATACDTEEILLTRSAIQKLMSSGAVSCNGSVISKSRKITGGEQITVTLPEASECDAEPEDIPLDTVYEDDDIIVVNKAQGMVVHPAPGHLHGTLVSALLWECGSSLSGIGGVMRPGIVHRIDKDTSGLICAAKNDAAHISLSEQLKDHSMHRVYLAVCNGRLRNSEGRVEAPIGRSHTDRKRMAVRDDGKPAATNYTVLEEFSYPGGCASLLRLVLETGRTHQIRVHMAYLGHPLLGDSVYGGGQSAFEKRHPSCFSGQCLHAEGLTLRHPRTGEEMIFNAAPPENFNRVLKLLRDESSNR